MALQFGMPVGFQELLDRKYRIMQQAQDTAQFQADTQRTGVVADAALTNERARLLPTTVAAEVANLNSRTAGQDITNQFLPATLQSGLNLQGAQTRLLGAQTFGVEEETEARRLGNVGLRRGLQRRPGSAFGLGAGYAGGLSF